MKTIAIALALTACTFPTRSDQLACETTAECDDGRVCQQGFCVSNERGGSDAGQTDDDPLPDADTFDCAVFSTRHFGGCDIPQPTGVLELTGSTTYDTDSGALSTGTSVPSAVIGGAQVISVQSFSLAEGATLRVTGEKPLIIASWSTITIAGTLDVGSTIAKGSGAGANPADCTARAATVGQAEDGGAGGGGGGGYRALGGRGGNGDGNGGTAGVAVAAAPLLAGGCAGAQGGFGRADGGVGGAGGGAVQLAALESITIATTGKIHAGGAGGGGAQGENGGGGGGGSGGMIGLESNAITISGTLAANGGAGGGGSTSDGGALGQAGQDAQLTATRALGGAPNNGGGGRGGLGGAGTTIVGNQGQDVGGDAGGGGGGACGFVVVASTQAPTLGGTITPAATTVAR